MLAVIVNLQHNLDQNRISDFFQSLENHGFLQDLALVYLQYKNYQYSIFNLLQAVEPKFTQRLCCISPPLLNLLLHLFQNLLYYQMVRQMFHAALVSSFHPFVLIL